MTTQSYPTNNLTGDNLFNVRIDGAVFTPTYISGAVSQGKINIVANKNGGEESIKITVPASITTGTYTLVAFDTYSAQYNAFGNVLLMVSNGNVTIIEHNTVTKKLIGSFNFVATQHPTGNITANLTSGSFTIFY